jgi:uncharacterized protein (TIGR03435 family)
MTYQLPSASSLQISGGPAWIDSDKFDIVATVDDSTFAQLSKLSPEQQGEQHRMMIQQLLSDRFALRIHRERRELTVYTLVIAKGGPKLKSGQLQSNLLPNLPQSRINTMGPGFLAGHNATTALLVKTLSGQPEIGGRTVIDKTGLSEKYDFTLKWMPENAADARSPRTETQEDLPTLFTALQEQLGLRLASAKALLDVIKVDNADMPSEN